MLFWPIIMGLDFSFEICSFGLKVTIFPILRRRKKPEIQNKREKAIVKFCIKVLCNFHDFICNYFFTNMYKVQSFQSEQNVAFSLEICLENHLKIRIGKCTSKFCSLFFYDTQFI